MKSTNHSTEYLSIGLYDNSLHSTTKIKPYLPPDNRSRNKHRRMKTDELNAFRGDSTISTSADLKAKILQPKVIKATQRLSGSEANLKKTRSQKQISSTIPVKTCSLTRSGAQKIVVQRRMCTMQSLQKLNQEMSTMNPEKVTQEHKRISQKLKQKSENSRPNQSSLISEYQLLTQQLFQVIGGLKKKQERQLALERSEQAKREQKMLKKYQELLEKSRTYSVVLNEVRKETNLEALLQKKHISGMAQ